MGSPVTWQINPNFNWTGEQPIAQARPTATNALTRPQDSGASPGTLPTSSPTLGAGPTGGLDMGGVQALMDKLLPQSARVTPEEFKAAMTPIAQKGPVATPAAFGYRTPNPPAPQMLSGAVGAGAARGQGISNAVSATVGALAQFKATRDQRRQEADATKVSRLVEAQNAIGQAQQVLAADPNNQAAKKAIEDNNNIIQGMFQDPKFVKTVEKGFQISLTDPSQNKTPDHNIVQRGLDMFRQRSGQQLSPQAAQQMAQQAQQRFTAAQPTQMAQNTQAMQQLQLKMAQQKATEDYVKAFSPMMVQASKFQQAQILQGAQQSFKASQDLLNYARAVKIQSMKGDQASALADTRWQRDVQLEGIRAANRLTYLSKAVASRYDNPLAQQQLIDSVNKQWEADMDKSRTRISTAENQVRELYANKKYKEPSGWNAMTEAQKQEAYQKVLGDSSYNMFRQAVTLQNQVEAEKTLFKGYDETHQKGMDAIRSIIQGGKPDAGQSPTGIPAGTPGPESSGVPPAEGAADTGVDPNLAAAGAEEDTFSPASTDYSQWALQ